MSLREKFAWASLLTIVLSIVVYVVTLSLGYQRILSSSQVLGMFMVLILALIVLPLGIRALLAMRMPRGAATAQDERERLFEFQATRIAFFVLAVSVLVITAITVHGGANRRDIAHGVLIATVLAYLVKFGAEIRYHRRGY
jgi:hypothetical protein